MRENSSLRVSLAESEQGFALPASKVKVLFIAPQPPPITGHSLASKVLLDHLREKHEVKVVNLSIGTQHNGSVTVGRLLEVFKLLYKVSIWKKRSDLIYITISESFFGNLKDLAIYTICLGNLSKVYIHLHGGSLCKVLFKRHPILRVISTAFFRYFAGVIVTGPSHIDILSTICDRSKIHVVNNFAEDYLFVPEPAIRAKFSRTNSFRLVYISSITQDKGFLNLIDGYASLPEQIRSSMVIDMAGKFESVRDKAILESRLAKLPCVHYHGIVDGEAKRALFEKAHAFCLPTAHNEGQPISILEAYATGCVVLATMRGGIPDIFTPDVNGFAISENSPAGVRAALETAYQRAAELGDIAIANRRIAESDYRVSDFCRHVDEVFEESIVDEVNRVGLISRPAQMASRPYQMCINCVMDTTDSAIVFDAKGMCDHCVTYIKNTLPHWQGRKDLASSLESIVASIKAAGKGYDFDCIIGMSGGIDSSYLAYVVKEQLNLRPLAFHVDGGWNSQESTNNIERLIAGLGLDLYTEVIDWNEMRDLQLAFFKAGVPHIDVPQDHAIFASMYNFASKQNVKYILTGGNFSTECVKNPLEWMYFQTDVRQIKDIQRKFGRYPLKNFPLSNILRHKIYLRYFRGIRVERPLDYVEYNKDKAMKLLEVRFGWQRYPQKHYESRFTKFYEGYWLPKKFGFDTRKVQLSSLILTNQMTRALALEILKEPGFTAAELAQEFEFVATKLGITTKELQHYMDSPNKTYRDYKSQSAIFATGAWGMKMLGLEPAVKR
jgi:N-acetyl sugar amidotransferase